MLSLSTVLYSPITFSVVSINLPTEAEFKAKLEDEFNQFSNYYVLLFAVSALIFIVRGIVS
jgi:hypothetical protein